MKNIKTEVYLEVLSEHNKANYFTQGICILKKKTLGKKKIQRGMKNGIFGTGNRTDKCTEAQTSEQKKSVVMMLVRKESDIYFKLASDEMVSHVSKLTFVQQIRGQRCILGVNKEYGLLKSQYTLLNEACQLN